MHGVATEHTFSRCCSKTSPNEARPFTNLSLSLCSHTYTYTQSANSISNFPTRNSQSHRTLLQTELGQIIRSKEGGEERLREREKKRARGWLRFNLRFNRAWERGRVLDRWRGFAIADTLLTSGAPRNFSKLPLQLRHSANFTSRGRERERGKD